MLAARMAQRMDDVDEGGPMMSERTVLLLGGTGRTGGRVMEQLLERGVRVRAIVRSKTGVDARVAEAAKLELVEGSPLELPDEDLARQVRGCDAVVSCLGHNSSFKGVFGSPHDLVTRATARICRAAASQRPGEPVKLVLMSSVSVNGPAEADARRGAFERATLAMLRGVLPPAKDNQRAADFLRREVGASSPWTRWVAVRPDSLLEGDVSGYTTHDGLVASLFAPDRTNMANVAHFMCELVTDDAAWDQWEGKLPVIVNAVTA